MTDQANVTQTETTLSEGVPQSPVCQLNQFRYGQPCPSCGSDQVNYDGLLNLVCRACGLRQAGAFT